MTLDITQMMIVIGALSGLLGLGTSFWNIFSSGAKKNAMSIAALHKADEELDRRLARVEQTIAALPGRDQLHQLQLNLVEIGGELREMRAIMDGNTKIMGRLENIVSRHEDHLLDGAKR